MSDPASRLRLIPGGDASRRRRRTPGPAVLLVFAYALLFAAGLWIIRDRTGRARGPAPATVSSRARRPQAGEAAPPREAFHSRASLLAGLWIPAALKSRYFGRLAAECCTCGCELSIHDCLERDASCSRSPDLAEAIGRSVLP